LKENPERLLSTRVELSRREFAMSAAMAAAAIALPTELAAQQQKPPSKPPAETPAPVKPPETEGPKLSEAAKKEVELKVQWVMDRYGARLSEAQKTDVRKAVASTQEGLESLRAFAIENWDEPATVLHFNDVNASASAGKGARR
jgi:predicted Zn-dependent protease